MSTPQVKFEEKQHLGTNKHTLSLRLFLSLLCFTLYYFSNIPEEGGDLLFFLGCTILVISVVLLFVTHLHTLIESDSLVLTSILGIRKVKVPLNNIVTVERIKYSTYFINYPVYNLHVDGTIKFYTSGPDAVKLTDKDGSEYLIGTRKPEELLRVIKELIRQRPPRD